MGGLQEKRRRYRQAARIDDDLDQRWVAVVSEESLQQSAKKAPLVDYTVDVPDVLHEYEEVSGRSVALGLTRE
ncbi:MAG: hypothetical protein IIB14_10020 [Chloroflexi bacterium]|nr:hypothetical protein [Chloroflexota bacterium]